MTNKKMNQVSSVVVFYAQRRSQSEKATRWPYPECQMLMDVSAYGDSFNSAHTLRFRVQELGWVGYKDYRSCSKQIKLSGSAEWYLM